DAPLQVQVVSLPRRERRAQLIQGALRDPLAKASPPDVIAALVAAVGVDRDANDVRPHRCVIEDARVHKPEIPVLARLKRRIEWPINRISTNDDPRWNDRAGGGQAVEVIVARQPRRPHDAPGLAELDQAPAPDKSRGAALLVEQR